MSDHETPAAASTPLSDAASQDVTSQNAVDQADRTEAQARSAARTIEDPKYRAGLIDILSVIAYGELSGAFATVHDATRAPRLDHKLSLARMAVSDFGHFEKLTTRLRELGVEPETSMEPFTAAIDEWHRRTPPADWYEGLMKAYAGTAIATDFYSEIAQYLDDDSRMLIEDAVENGAHNDFAEHVLKEAIDQDSRLGSRLALWGRRIVGEALSQAQRVAAEHDALTGLLVDDGSGVGADLAELSRMFERLTTNHTARMEALGLSA